MPPCDGVAYVAGEMCFFRGQPRAVALSLLWLMCACPSEDHKQQALAREAEYTSLCATYPEWDLERGRRVFERVCGNCHQPSGMGTPLAIPPLKGHVPELLRADGGAQYLANVVVFGLAGELYAQGKLFDNRMPAHGPILKDDDLVAALRYVSLMWGNDEARANAPLVSKEQIAEARAQHKTAKKVRASRPRLASSPGH